MQDDQEPLSNEEVDAAAEDLKPDQDDLEWGQAAEEFAAEKGAKLGDPVDKAEDGKDGKKPEDKKPEGDKPVVDPAKAAEAKKKADELEAEMQKTETPEETKARHEEEEKAAKQAEADKAAENPAYRDQRAVQREIQADEQAMKDDVRKEMFSDMQTELLDGDGDPMNTIEDVMKHINPNTKTEANPKGRAFNEEEAAMYLLRATQHLKETNAKIEKQIEDIATVNMDIRDQADAVRTKYGAVLKKMPDVAKKLYAEYQNTLVKDEKTGIITKAPVNMETFYEVALAPYQKTAEDLNKNTEAEEKAAKDKKEAERQKIRQDRGDIYGGGKPDNMDADEKEWADAAKVVYGK